MRKRGNKEDAKIRKRKGEERKDVNTKFRGEEEEKREGERGQIRCRGKRD